MLKKLTLDGGQEINQRSPEENMQFISKTIHWKPPSSCLSLESYEGLDHYNFFTAVNFCFHFQIHTLQVLYYQLLTATVLQQKRLLKYYHGS